MYGNAYGNTKCLKIIYQDEGGEACLCVCGIEESDSSLYG